ncbi:MAG: hypothetical protein KF770_17850 [Anaerolineae bacterium]|nr:hypothetical protein [Anaerolineae bacterium]
MQTLNLKPNHKAVRDYYAALGQTQQLSDITNDPIVNALPPLTIIDNP